MQGFPDGELASLE